jgi:hypothetical protein
MLNLYFRPYVPGFSVKAHDELPGFNISENGKPRRAAPGFNVDENDIAMPRRDWFGAMRFPSMIADVPTSPQTSISSPLVNPYYPTLGTAPYAAVHSEHAQSADGSLGNIFPVADDRDAAWAKCHARCVPLTVGRGYGSGAPGRYRRCMRDCLAQHGHFDY